MLIIHQSSILETVYLDSIFFFGGGGGGRGGEGGSSRN